jgi:hypothetical protein
MRAGLCALLLGVGIAAAASAPANAMPWQACAVPCSIADETSHVVNAEYRYRHRYRYRGYGPYRYSRPWRGRHAPRRSRAHWGSVPVIRPVQPPNLATPARPYGGGSERGPNWPGGPGGPSGGGSGGPQGGSASQQGGGGLQQGGPQQGGAQQGQGGTAQRSGASTTLTATDIAERKRLCEALSVPDRAKIACCWPPYTGECR